MIKKLPILFVCFLSSCQNTNLFDLDLASAPRIAKESLFGFDIKVDQAFIDSKQFSFMKLTLNKRASILSLSDIASDGTYRWVSNDGAIFLTNNGKILKTYGLKNNYEVLEKGSLYKPHLIKYSAPRAIFSKNIAKLTDKVSNVREEIFTIKELNWTGVDKYLFNEDSGLPISSSQHIFPNQGAVKLEFYYKYKKRER